MSTLEEKKYMGVVAVALGFLYPSQKSRRASSCCCPEKLVGTIMEQLDLSPLREKNTLYFTLHLSLPSEDNSFHMSYCIVLRISSDILSCRMP
ncbi:hypothetical protein Y1Q_0008932 [Alligator mississippiensis]|uniref:Uncharacterized protein n=1 Tax=Alligator mississippiensis TaxID=8496 RepID=A0A151NKE0_ALLMI|nr:hypothetical protein Y1Q_0008932 [Alligator mississippiensis]